MRSLSRGSREAKHKALQWLFDRYIRWNIKDFGAPNYAMVLEYPIRPVPRYGESKPAHTKITSLFSAHDGLYRQTLLELASFVGKLKCIPEDAGTPTQCCWNNIFFSALDAIALYGLLGRTTPTQYFEVGSGNSTKFARRAIEDFGLKTTITSIDPAPRAEVDQLCDHIIRQPVEDVDMEIFEQLGPGDMLFIDNSHRAFQNSDVTVFFLDILPSLKPGILVHLHDIFLPFDYPSLWADRHYSEQYLLATHLLANLNADLVLPLAYLCKQKWSSGLMNEIWADPIFQRAFDRYRNLTGGYSGVSFWMRSR